MTETGEWTDDEVEAFVATYQGDAAVQELRAFRSYTSDGPWRANSLAGYGSRYCRDIRVAPLNHNFSIVYWDGEGSEAIGVWSFHIAHFRPNATQFDERYDGHLTLADEHLRVLVACEAPEGRVPLREGALVVREGDLVWLEHNPVGGPQVLIPIIFPRRKPRHVFPGTIFWPDLYYASYMDRF